jgi:molybdenum cofactor cytidylyltransferase
MADVPVVQQEMDSVPKPFRFGVVLLAAGASTRMGQPKQLIEVGGKALVVRAVEAALASAAWPVVVVLGANAEIIRPQLARLPVLIAENPAWTEGMASSLRAGVGTLQTFSRGLDGALVAVADQPAFSADVIARLVAVRQGSRQAARTATVRLGSPQAGRGIVAARYAGRLGVPALFGREHFTALTALTGEEGARHFLAAHAAEAAAVDLPELAVDLDTPEDVAAWQER